MIKTWLEQREDYTTQKVIQRFFKKSHFFALPGVPQEMKSMMTNYVLT